VTLYQQYWYIMSFHHSVVTRSQHFLGATSTAFWPSPCDSMSNSKAIATNACLRRLVVFTKKGPQCRNTQLEEDLKAPPTCSLTSQDDEAPSSSSPAFPRSTNLITSVRHNAVLMVPGAGSNDFIGNHRFRDHVKQRKEDSRISSQ
jgi:hypothetical protein